MIFKKRKFLIKIGSDNENGNEVAMKYPGGCGRVQPKYRRSGLDLYVEWKEAPDENQEKNRNYQRNVFFQSLKQYHLKSVTY